MLSVSSLNIISSHETSFSSLARGSSRCWESSRSLYLLLHTPLLPASCRDKELHSPGASSPSTGSWGWGFGPQGAGGLGMGLGMTGFTPKRNLVNESTALWRDFLSVLQGPGAAGRDRQGPGAGGCANLTTTPGRFLWGCPFHTSPLGCARMDKNIRIHRGKTKTAVAGSKVTSWKRQGVWGSLCPLLSSAN